MSKTPNYSNPKVAKELDRTILAIAKTLPKLEAARDGNYFRKSEMKDLCSLASRINAAIQFFDAAIQLAETKKETK